MSKNEEENNMKKIIITVVNNVLFNRNGIRLRIKSID